MQKSEIYKQFNKRRSVPSARNVAHEMAKELDISIYAFYRIIRDEEKYNIIRKQAYDEVLKYMLKKSNYGIHFDDAVRSAYAKFT